MAACATATANDSRMWPRLVDLARRSLLVAAAAAAALLSSCGKSDTQVLTEACVSATGSVAALAPTAQLSATCACASNSARTHLDPEDYKLLVRFARVSGESAPTQIKADQLITALLGWGVSGPKAAAAVIDIMSFEAHAAQECRPPAAGDI